MKTRAALALADRQLDPEPCVWPAFVTTFAQHRECYVLRSDEYGMLRDENDRIVTFAACILYSNVEGECWSHSTCFSLS